MSNQKTRVIEFKVAGVTFDGRQEYIKLLSGSEPVQIVPEPENAYDKNALAVHAALAHGAVHIGYIPRDLAAEIAPLLDGEAVVGEVWQITGGFERSDGSYASLGVVVKLEVPNTRVYSHEDDMPF